MTEKTGRFSGASEASHDLAEKARALAVTFGSYLYHRGVLIHSGDEQKLTELIEAALREAAEDRDRLIVREVLPRRKPKKRKK